MVMVGTTKSFQLAFKNLNYKFFFSFFKHCICMLLIFTSLLLLGGDVYKFQFLCILCLCGNCCVLSIIVVFFVNVWIRGV
jgi:hypothetical protein